MSTKAKKRLGDARVAVVHDWLPVYAGAERVLEHILEVLPGADVYSLVEFLPEDQRAFLGGKTVTTSFIQRLPLARKHYRYYLGLAPMAIEQFDLRRYDVIVSSSYVVAKAVLTTSRQLHVSYVHSPVRYAWDLYFQYLDEGGLRRGVRSWMARAMLHYIRQFDVATANRVDHYLANSAYVARRVEKTYRREATVIYPPVDVNRFRLNTVKEDYFVTVSRLVPYKRIDLIAEAFTRMPERRMLIVGDGPERARVEAAAGPNVTLLGYRDDADVAQLVGSARAFVFAAEEDFGIVPCEAQAAGTPVIGYGAGGLAETVVDGVTGVLFHEQSVDSLVSAVEEFDEMAAEFSPVAIRENALRFSADRFQHEFRAYLETAFDLHQEGRPLELERQPLETRL